MTKNRPLAVICAVLLMISQSQTDYVLGVKVTAATFCSPFEECDQFNTTANPATGWTAGPSSGAWQTNGTQMVPPSGSVTATLNNTVAGATQYAIVKLVDATGEESGVTLRRGNGEQDYYRVYWTGSLAYWASHANADDSFNAETTGCATTAFTDGDYMVALVSGTDTNTFVRVWNRGQTAPTAVPTTGDSCGALCCEFTSNIGSYSNGGNQVGLYIHSGATTRRFDDFAAGGS